MDSLFSLNSRETFFRTILGLSLLISIFLSHSLVNENYHILFFLVGTSLSFFLMKSKTLPIIIILSVIPFTNWAIEQGFLPFQIMWFPELLSGLLFLKSLILTAAKKQKYRTFGIKVVFLFLVVALFSLIYNSSNLIPAVLMLRLLLRYYLLFLAIINLGLDKKATRLIIKSMIIIFVLQLPVSIVKLIVYGQGERSMGLSSHSISTIIPLIAISFLYSFYYLYKKKVVYLLGIFCFVGFSFVGGKRAFIFFLIILLIFLTWILKEHIKLNIRAILLGIIIIFISFYFAARLLPRFNPQNRVWGDFSFKHIINFAVKYETNVTETGMSTGRISTMVNVFNHLSGSGFFHLTFGFGPGSIIKSMFATYDRSQAIKASFGIEYGVNGLSWLAIQVGYLGALLYFLFLYLFLKESLDYFKKEPESYWRSFASGMVGFSFILILTSLFYSPFFNFDAISVFYFCLIAILMLKKNACESKEVSAGPIR